MLIYIIHLISFLNRFIDSKFTALMNSSKDLFISLVYSSNLPEFILLLFVCVLICIAVRRKESSVVSYNLTLLKFLKYTAYFFFAIGTFWLFIGFFFKYHAPYENFFMFYKTIRINLFILRIKTVIALLVGCTLLTARRYLLLNNLVNYEYPLVISLATLGMFISVMANNWIILFLSLELQALCLLVLFAWNRKDLNSINAALKFTIVNFVASILILLAIVFIVLHTQSLNIYYSNPYFLIKQVEKLNLIGHLIYQNNITGLDLDYLKWLGKQTSASIDLFYNQDAFLEFVKKYQYFFIFYCDLLKQLHSYFEQLNFLNMFNYSRFHNYFLYFSVFLLKTYDNVKVVLLFDFVSFLLIIGFAIKLGLAPFGMWLQDLYKGVPLPVLNFFATAPKFVYLTILVSLYLNLFAFVNGKHFLNMLLILSIVCIVVANFAMFSIGNQLLHLLAWSSVANMGLLFFLLSRFPYKSYNIVFMIYYTVASLLFFLALQFIVIRDSRTNENRNVLYFTDLALLRHTSGNRPLFLVALFSLLSFFGIPPFIGFWMKFTAYYGIVKAMFMPYEVFTVGVELLKEGYTINFLSWVFIIIVLYVTLVGSYNYLRLFYAIVGGEHHDMQSMNNVYCPNTKLDTQFVVYLFVFLQVLFTVNYVNLTDMFDVQSLSLAVVKYPR